MTTHQISTLLSHAFTALCVVGGLIALATGLWAAAAVLLFGSTAHAWAVHHEHQHHHPLV